MAATFTPEYEVTEVEVTPADGRRRKITKFALAGVAVLGIGAALTSAAWTDDVFFRGSASSGEIELSGSTTNATSGYQPADTEGTSTLVIDDFVIGPNTVETKSVWVRNDGDLPLRIIVGTPVAVGPLFTNGAVASAVSLDGDGLLGLNEWAEIEVTVRGNTAWSGDTMQGQLSADNSIVLQVQGTTDLVGP